MRRNQLDVSFCAFSEFSPELYINHQRINNARPESHERDGQPECSNQTQTPSSNTKGTVHDQTEEACGPSQAAIPATRETADRHQHKHRPQTQKVIHRYRKTGDESLRDCQFVAIPTEEQIKQIHIRTTISIPVNAGVPIQE